MKKQNIYLVIFLSVIALELLILILLKFYHGIQLKEFSTIFTNFSTPIITAVALIIYYLSLVQMRKQTDILSEENKILRGENIYKEFLIKIQELKEIASKKDLGTLLPKDVTKSSFSILTIYTNSIIETVRKLKTDKDYKKYLEINVLEAVTDEEIFNFSFNEYYIALNSINNNLSIFLFKVNFIISEVVEDKSLHESYRNLLLKYIAKEILFDYFLLILNKDHFDYFLIPHKLNGHELLYKTAFDSYNIESVYRFYKKNLPEIIEEVVFLKR